MDSFVIVIISKRIFGIFFGIPGDLEKPTAKVLDVVDMNHIYIFQPNDMNMEITHESLEGLLTDFMHHRLSRYTGEDGGIDTVTYSIGLKKFSSWVQQTLS